MNAPRVTDKAEQPPLILVPYPDADTPPPASSLGRAIGLAADAARGSNSQPPQLGDIPNDSGTCAGELGSLIAK